MSDKPVVANREVDALYAHMRTRHGDDDSRANGYVFERYFRAEQAHLFALMREEAAVVCDVACGSGLMLQPLIGRRELVLGVDFNRDACLASQKNGIAIMRGDAFNLPLATASVDEIVCCQFFNQQAPVAVSQFVKECARVLKNDGRAILVWRNGSALIHRLALAVFGTLDRLRGRPIFPYENHPFTDMRGYAADVQLEVELEQVSFPLFNWRSSRTESLAARAIGASNICILRKSS